MNEMSREEAIKNLSQVMQSLDYIEIDEELNKAISDMKKLQKIEEIMENGAEKCEECEVDCDYFIVATGGYCLKLIEYDEIEMIVRGDVNE